MNFANRLIIVSVGLLSLLGTMAPNAYAQVQGGIERPDRRPGDGDPHRPGRPDHPGRPGGGPERPDPRPEPPRNDPYRPDPYRPEPVYPGDRSADVRRTVYNETLSVDRLLYLNRSEMADLRLIRVQFQRPYRAAVIELLVNGFVVTSQTVYDGREIEMMMPERRRDFRDINYVDLRVRGSIYIERISADISERYDRPIDRYEETVSLYVGRYTSRADRIDLTRTLDRYMYDGYEISEVRVDAEDRRGMGEVGLAIDGYSVSMTSRVNNYGETRIYPDRTVRLSRYNRNIELLTRGDIYVRTVTIVLRR